MRNEKTNKAKKQIGKVKPYQEINEAISKDEALRHRQTPPQPKDFEEIEY